MVQREELYAPLPPFHPCLPLPSYMKLPFLNEKEPNLPHAYSDDPPRRALYPAHIIRRPLRHAFCPPARLPLPLLPARCRPLRGARGAARLGVARSPMTSRTHLSTLVRGLMNLLSPNDPSDSPCWTNMPGAISMTQGRRKRYLGTVLSRCTYTKTLIDPHVTTEFINGHESNRRFGVSYLTKCGLHGDAKTSSP
jgi:hypothetical protein